MQLPVVVLEITAKGEGSQQLIMIEQQAGVNYMRFL